MPADVEAVFSLSSAMATTAIVDHEVFVASYADLMERGDGVVLAAVAEDGAASGAAGSHSVIVGYLLGFDHLAFYANGRVAYVEEVAVRVDRQGEGVGRLLMDAFEVWAATRSAVLVTVATRRAREFYVAIGYEETATLFRKLF
jgi:GNAT superfamily N-acetyltransferase